MKLIAYLTRLSGIISSCGCPNSYKQKGKTVHFCNEDDRSVKTIPHNALKKYL
jgi:hypothetical protein